MHLQRARFPLLCGLTKVQLKKSSKKSQPNIGDISFLKRILAPTGALIAQKPTSLPTLLEAVVLRGESSNCVCMVSIFLFSWGNYKAMWL